MIRLPNSTSAAERGSALATTMFAVVLMVGTTGAFLAVTQARSQEQVAHLERERGRRATNGGIGIKLAQLSKDSTATGVISGRMADGTLYAAGAIVVSGSTSGLFRVGGYSESGRASHRVSLLVQQETEPVSGYFPGGVVANGEVRLNGNITIDGRDFEYDGASVVGSGVYGVHTRSTLLIAGAAAVGGNNQAPSGSETSQNRVENATWGDGTDANGNGVIDPEEEAFPSSEDAVFGLPPGTLKNMARSSGTYFASATEWTNYVSYYNSNNLPLPGGVVFYLDFIDSTLNIDFPNAMSDPPSIFVNHVRDPNATDPHDPAGIAQLNNIHGKFRGVMIVDAVKHFNGGFEIIGGIVSLATQDYGNVFGNGNAHIKYSKKVLNRLPRVAKAGSPFRVLSWTEEGARLDQSPVKECVDAVRALKSGAAIQH